MVWFKTDDGWHSHRKVIGLSLAARGLWISAGSWCGFHLTDGVVPFNAMRLLRGSKRLAKALVDAGLWEVCPQGWQFHEWEHHQPTRAEVVNSRTLKTQRQARWRGKKDDVVDASTQRLTDATPTRPDPTRPDIESPSETLAPPTATPTSERKPKKVLEHTDTHKLRTAFENAFRLVYGHDASWSAACGAQASRLVKQHGLAECCRRLGIYFNDPPHWMAEGSRDFLSFARFFDKLAVGASGPQANGVASTRPNQPPALVASARADRFGDLAARVAQYEATQRDLTEGTDHGRV